MLVIRREQLEEITAARWREFERSAIRYWVDQYSAKCTTLDSERAADLVSVALTRARSQGFETTKDLIGYLDLILTIGPDFADQPWALEILGMTEYLPATRLELLCQTAADRSRGTESPLQPEPDNSFCELSAAWPEPNAQPVPPPPVLLPPDSSCLPPPIEFRRGRNGC